MAAVNAERRLSKRERAEQTRTRIIDAAYRLFTQHGYEATTMQAVADEARVAVQTVCFTFHTKGGLLTAIESRAVGEGEALAGAPEQRERHCPDERGACILVAKSATATAVVRKPITAFV